MGNDDTPTSSQQGSCLKFWSVMGEEKKIVGPCGFEKQTGDAGAVRLLCGGQVAISSRNVSGSRACLSRAGRKSACAAPQKWVRH
uniref:Uncharacterized protein n=1 Tax=Physcomitrium patens TaxID=3218 RepID=A0A2K1KB92_PHYPA|nr:hypothetical protein PHYPA_010231 [Physcomitrium patens]